MLHGKWNVATSACVWWMLWCLWTGVVSSVDVDEKTVKTDPTHEKVVVCYVCAKAAHRPGRGSFTLEDVDPSLCTHLVYASVGVHWTPNSIHSLEKDKAAFKKMAAMKERNPHLRVTLAVGGKRGSYSNYSKIASTQETRKVFIQSAVNLIRDYSLDGLDLHWMYPGMREGHSEDNKANFVSLAKELRTAFKDDWILSASFVADVAAKHDVMALSQHLDLMHIACYDYNVDTRLDVNAPLLYQPDKKSVMDTIEYFLDMGAPPQKLVLGLAMFGRTYIVDGKEEDAGDYFSLPASKGLQGPFTREDGFLGYNEICSELNADNSWKKYWDSKTETPYAVNGSNVISYDNERSLRMKVKYAMDKQLAGLMIWTMDNDDFRGNCDVNSNTTYPLLRAINKMVNTVHGKLELTENCAAAAIAAKSCILAVVIIALLRLS